MISADETALICDFAETYHIYDYRARPVRQAAALAAGLGEGSRIWKKLNGFEFSLSTILMAEAVDALNMLVWFQTEDASKGKNRPESVLRVLTGDDIEDGETDGFKTGDDFDKWRKEMRENG